MPQMSFGWLMILYITAIPAWGVEPEFVRIVLAPIEDVQVSGEDSGLVRDVHVQLGQHVERDSVLLTLTDEEARLKLLQAVSAREIAAESARNSLPIELARKTLAVAQTELNRAEEINRRNPGTVTAAEVDRLRLTFERAELELQQAMQSRHIKELEAQQAEVAVKLAEAQLARRQIKAPCSGIVVQIDRRPGEWLTAGDAACRLIDCRRLRADGRVPFPGSQIQSGQNLQVLVTLNGKEQQFPGVVVYVSPELESVRGERLIRIELENPDAQLSPGMVGRFQLPNVDQDTP